MSDVHKPEGHPVTEPAGAPAAPATAPAAPATAPAVPGGATPAAAPVTRRTGLTADPVSRKLVIAIFGVLILWMAGVVSALVLGLLTPAAPRTATERALRVYESSVRQGTVDPALWADYTRVLISVGQYSKAERMIDQALKVVKTQKSAILAERARLDIARNDYDGAVKSADIAIKAVEAERKKLEEQYAKQGMTTQSEYPRAYRDALLLKAEAYSKSGRPKQALAAYDRYLEVFPTAADVLVLRADLRAESGDKRGAEADYKLAMKYVPDYEAARNGLKKIGAEIR